MDKYYVSRGWSKFAEVDTYQEGCDPSTTQNQSGSDCFKGNTIEEVIKKCMDFVGADSMDSCLLDSCEELGRLDIQTLENDGGYTAYDRDIKLWRTGQLQLWSCTYSFRIVLCQEEVVSLLQGVSL